MATVTAAIKERRMLGESLRHLVGADVTSPHGSGIDEEQVRPRAEVIVARRDLDAQASFPSLRSLPDIHT
jgi:hypothetical protein